MTGNALTDGAASVLLVVATVLLVLVLLGVDEIGADVGVDVVLLVLVLVTLGIVVLT